jgi:hypothetical protein
MKAFILMSFVIAISGCSTHKDTVYYSEYRNEWVDKVFKYCQQESFKLTVALYESEGRVWNQGQVNYVNKFLSDSCVKHAGISI